MTQAVAARRDGDTFQARVFWQKAALLLNPDSPVIRVGFENGPKGFDDVWVDYDPKTGPNLYGLTSLGREHTQCKWHGTPDTYGYSSLIDPEFINANAISFLQRGYKAQREYTVPERGARFRLLTNWRIDRNDPLRNLVNERTHSLRLERLFTGGDRSGMGKVRKLWADHLGISENELSAVASVLALSETTDSLEQLRDRLDELFQLVGLRRIPANESAFPYDDLPYQWLAQGRLEFDKTSFRKICEREGLLVGPKYDGPKVYGVKSFEHRTDKLEDRCVAVLDLLASFNERQIRPEADWAKILYPALSAFLVQAAQSSDRLRLILDAHLTLSFAAGSVLDIKSGRVVELEQRSIGKMIWSPDDTPFDSAWPDWEFQPYQISDAGADIAVAVSLTHDTAAAVQEYVKRALPTVGTILLAQTTGGPGARAVQSGHHAFRLGEALTAKIRAMKTPGTKSHLHLFMAAPGGFAFFLGQRHVALGPLTLYEFDFEAEKDGSYEPSLSLPVKLAPVA
jgi:hypothetical protein